MDRFPGHAGAVEAGFERADHALRPAEKDRQSSGVIARCLKDRVGSQALVDGRVQEVEAKLVVAVGDSLQLGGERPTTVRRGVEKSIRPGPGSSSSARSQLRNGPIPTPPAIHT